jgi:hypothetical protein
MEVIQTRVDRVAEVRITGVRIMAQVPITMALVRVSFRVQDRIGIKITAMADKAGDSNRRKAGADSSLHRDGTAARISMVLGRADTVRDHSMEIIIQIREVTDLNKVSTGLQTREDIIRSTREDMDLIRGVPVRQTRVGKVRDNHPAINTVPEIIMAPCNRGIHVLKMAIDRGIAAGIRTRMDSTQIMRTRSSITLISAAEDIITSNEDTGIRKVVITRKGILVTIIIMIPVQIMNPVAA